MDQGIETLLRRRPKRIGLLLPSSNTVAEPLFAAMLAPYREELCLHVSRFRVTTITWDAADQFDEKPMLEGASLLADAKVDLILYAATSGAWLHAEADARLCERIEQATGIAATTSILDLYAVLTRYKAQRIAILAGYTPDLMHRVESGFRKKGIACAGWRTFAIADNHQLSGITREELLREARLLAGEWEGEYDALVTLGTNVLAAPLAARLEEEGISLVIDTVSASVRSLLERFGLPRSSGMAANWGRIFD
ncbi:Asp/Glu/hydantoin racemase [Paenibacillus sp. HB172176]|uniref:maleate cis-trans isomerase family protein n=1 Tax=Paenibacillus sp. HB172176 TaxID=2493690 RepID=UPI00143BDB1E|nr:Asp/Glu/hydantoin racemase [Paenibacillus sp. HB172176]